MPQGKRMGNGSALPKEALKREGLSRYPKPKSLSAYPKIPLRLEKVIAML
jgi:hypothetical protein